MSFLELEEERYRVRLEVFTGPLDLLLYLIRRNEVDIHDIPISLITEQYLEYLKDLPEIDINEVGEFLVMATTLMEIKSRMLLPRPEEMEDEEEEDPRSDLVRQLLEYKRYKDIAERLAQLAEERAQRFGRGMEDDVQPPGREIEDLSLWDLAETFARVLREISIEPPTIIYDDTPIEAFLDEIVNRLQKKDVLSLRELIGPEPERNRIIGLFLALLDLVKSRVVRVIQPEPFGEITIIRATPEAAPLGTVRPMPVPEGGEGGN